MKKRVVVIALGGNAILQPREKPTISAQFRNTLKAMESLLPLIKNSDVVITFGNGPQVGSIMIRVEEAMKKTYSIPLEVGVAESEGEMGYMIEQCLINVLNKRRIQKRVLSVLTQVVVDKKDYSFKHPSKPIGPFYTKQQAEILKNNGFHVMEDAGRGYRKIVPSPKPKEIVEAKTIQALVKQGSIVIAAGGGGIPVYRENNMLHGIAAVIDKDLASSCLAKSIHADSLVILTGVDYVYLDYNKKARKPIRRLSLKEAKSCLKQGQFPPGSMGPKIEAAIDFLEHGGKEVLITSPEKLKDAIQGKSGTWILKNAKKDS